MTPIAPPLTHVLIAERTGLLRRAWRIVGSAHAAEDVLQRLWLKVQQVDDPDAIRNPRAYLYRLAANLAIDHRRSEATRERIQAQADAYLWGAAEAASAEQVLIDRDTLARVMAALDGLPEPTRTMFRLNRFERMRIVDIAPLYDVSTTTVENHLRRALARLRIARDPDTAT